MDSLVAAACVTQVYRTRRLRGLHEATSATERAAVEGGERRRWLDSLVDLLEEAKLPVVRLAAGTADPAGALRHAAGALRARTLPARIRTWRKVRFWLLHVHRIPFPRSSGR